MDQKQAFIFFGNSGSGKGTQAKLLEDKLKEIDFREVLQIGTGERFRELIKKDDYVARKAAEITSQGRLQPVFLSVWNWTAAFMEDLKDDEHVILDGSPRRRREPPILESAFDFLDYKDVHIIFLDVSDDVVKERMESRGRSDDDGEKIQRRIDWFNKYVIPMLSYYKDNPRYKYHHINGGLSVEEVNKQVFDSIGI